MGEETKDAVPQEGKAKLTDQNEPNETRFEDRHNCQSDPERRRDIQAQPEESLICRSDSPSIRVGGLKNPVRVAIGRVDFIPPAETD